jgi:hypothetical protein
MRLNRVPIVAAAAVALVAAHVVVWLAPGRAVRWATGTERAHTAGADDGSALAGAFASAITAANARLPFRASCLVQGVALVMMLSVARVPSHLVVGVAREAPADLRAHAWVICGGQIVLGGLQATNFLPLARAIPRSCPW